jgi:hypothetical protein
VEDVEMIVLDALLRREVAVDERLLCLLDRREPDGS